MSGLVQAFILWVVLPLGRNSVIGAGSVVTKDVPENVIAAGVPCKVIREITDKDKTDFLG